MTDGKTASTGHPVVFHRLVPPLIGALSVVRHQVYWNLGPIRGRSADTSLPEIEQIKQATYGRPKQARDCFRSCEFSLSQPNTRMKYVYVWWMGMLVHVRIQQHTEYIAILTSINFARNQLNGEHARLKPRDYAELKKHYLHKDCADKRASVEKWLAFLGSVRCAEHNKRSALNCLLGPLDATVDDNSLFAQFDIDFDMKELQGLVLPGKALPGSSASAEKADDAGSQLIIDFRGLVTSGPSDDRTGLLGNFPGRKKKLFRLRFTDPARPVRDTGHLLAKKDRPAIEQEEGVLAKGGRDPWYLRTIGDYWRSVQPDSEVKYHEEIEFSATGLLDGRALFITHLALPPPDKAAEEADRAVPVSPIRFFLHCRRSDERQIGRMVDRLCTMATVRAALERHAAQILEKRRDLRVLLGSIEKSMDGLIFQNHILNTIILKQRNDVETAALQAKSDEQVDLMKANEGGPRDFFTLSNRKPLKDQSSRDVLRALSSGMNDLEHAIQVKLQLSPENKLDNVWGADDYMEYKVERATYYFDKFSRLELQIRVSRLEGFQTYPEFVKRRMQDAYAYVQNAKEYLREIADQRTRMSAQISNITQIVEAHESDEEQRKIAEIQDFAEFALLTFLLPYYFGYILKNAGEKLGWGTAAYASFFWLIIIFTVINLVKRGLEGKLRIREHFWRSKDERGEPTRGRFGTWEYWFGPKRLVRPRPRKDPRRPVARPPKIKLARRILKWRTRILRTAALLRRVGSIATRINFLSLLAIAVATFMLIQLSEIPKDVDKDDKVSTAVSVPAEAGSDTRGRTSDYGNRAAPKARSEN